MMDQGSGGTAREFVFVLCGARRDGNTEMLARRAAESLPASARQRWMRLIDLTIPPFEDTRHSGEGVYPAPTGDLLTLLRATLDATDLVFVAPLYWYSVPAAAKLYLDHWSAWMRVPGIEFKQRMAAKTLWTVTVISDEDRSVAGPLISMLRLTAAYMDMRWGGSLIGFGNRPGDITNDARALAEASTLFDPAAG